MTRNMIRFPKVIVHAGLVLITTLTFAVALITTLTFADVLVTNKPTEPEMKNFVAAMMLPTSMAAGFVAGIILRFCLKSHYWRKKHKMTTGSSL